MSPFEPVGEQARWRILYDILCHTRTDGIATYEQMGEALGLHPDHERHTIQMAVRRAAKELEEEDKRAIEAVPNVGYRIVEAPEHLRLARRQQKRAQVALRSGHSKVTNVDLNQLEPETRRAFEVVARAFAMQMDFNRRMDVRQRRLETAVATVTERHDRSEREIAELKERLSRIELLGQTVDKQQDTGDDQSSGPGHEQRHTRADEQQ